MRNVVTKAMPHGTIPFERIPDAATKDAVMKINENVRTLEKRLKAAEAAIRELQRRA